MGQEALTELMTPQAWAARITKMLSAFSAAQGTPRFPVDVAALAIDYTRQTCGDEHVGVVQGADITGFEGCLVPYDDGTLRWGIIYNETVTEGRQRFTIAHELGHFLLHRRFLDRKALRCSVSDVAGGIASQKEWEQQADTFASWLLMPFDDFREQLNPRDRPTVDVLSQLAHRYGTSLVATALRWVCCTELRAVVVLTRDGFIDWSWSSQKARVTRATLRARSQTIAAPPRSLAAMDEVGRDARDGIVHGPDVWFNVRTREMAVRSEGFGMTLSILLLDDDEPPWAARG